MTPAAMLSHSVDDEQRRARVRPRPMRLGAISYLVAHTSGQVKMSAVGKLRLERARDAEENVPLLAPMVRAITG